jgi:hypothetical protein
VHIETEQHADELLVSPRAEPAGHSVDHLRARVPLAAQDDVGTLGGHHLQKVGQQIGGYVSVAVYETEVTAPPAEEPLPHRQALAPSARQYYQRYNVREDSLEQLLAPVGGTVGNRHDFEGGTRAT